MEVQDISRKSLDQASCALSEKSIEDLKTTFLSGKPFPYLLKQSEFYHSVFFVNEDVLIPRPETEYLVDIIINEQKNVQRVLDVGTGSGVILLSLLKHGVGKSGVGADISNEALEVASVNAQRLNLKPEFINSDRLKNITGTFDLIVSNPPYIKTNSHRSLVHESVDHYEPHEALYIPDETYDQWFSEFFLQIKEHLNGAFYMEGHELELDRQAEMLKGSGFKNVKVLNDMTGTKRFLFATSGK